MKDSRTDGELVHQFIRDRQEDAFQEIVRRHSGVVLGVCRSILANRDDAEDAYQIAFATFVRRAESIQCRDSIAGWLYQVARRSALQLAKKRNVATVVSSPQLTHDECPFAVVARRELQAIVAEEIERLPHSYREAIVLVHLEGMSRSAAAKRLACTENAVKARLSRARQKLRLQLARRGVAYTLSLPLFERLCCESQATELTPEILHAVFELQKDEMVDGNFITDLHLSMGMSAGVFSLALVLALLPIPMSGDAGEPWIVAATPIQATQATRPVAFQAQPQGQGEVREFNFEKLPLQQTPEYWDEVVGAGRWQISNEHIWTGASGLEFSQDAEDTTNVCVISADHVTYSAVDVSTRLRLVGDKPPSSAGVVWGFRDAGNYYFADLSEDGMVRLCETVKGVRRRLLQVPAKLSGEKPWQLFRAVQRADEISIYVNDRRVVTHAMTEPPQVGKVGLVATGKQAWFDNFRVKAATTPFPGSVR